MYGFCCEVGARAGDRGRTLENITNGSNRGLVKTHFRTEKMEKLTDVFQEMKEGKLIGRVVIDLQ